MQPHTHTQHTNSVFIYTQRAVMRRKTNRSLSLFFSLAELCSLTCTQGRLQTRTHMHTDPHRHIRVVQIECEIKYVKSAHEKEGDILMH